MNRSEIPAWLLEENPDRLERLRGLADAVRRNHVAAAVHIRSLMEFPN